MKEFWKSKTLWGVAISLLPTILRVAGLPLPLGELATELIIAAGGGLAVFGRVKAVDKLTLRK